MPLISICIPAYLNPGFLKRLLDSITAQNFRDFEVIVSDDTPGNELEMVCLDYQNQFPLQYVHNHTPLGSPANWNNAIRLATGKWIKLIHADDWLATKNALQVFADAAAAHPDAGFFFSGYRKYEGNSLLTSHIPGKKEENVLAHSPLNLIAGNFIGHPSVTLILNRKTVWYDEKIKWMVDVEYYLRELKSLKAVAIPEALINIGVHPGQVTQQSIRQPQIEIPEHLYLIQKSGISMLKNIRVYDHYWRLFRNLGFRKIADVQNHSGGYPIPEKLIRMWKWQSVFPLWLLRIGPVSKMLMMINYVINR